MKKLIQVATFFLFVPLHSQAQTAPQQAIPVDSILATLQKINIALEERNYTRIPIKEFDDKLNQAVSKDIDSRWGKLIALFAGIGGVLLYAIYRSVISNIKEEMRKDMDKKMEEMNKGMDKKFTDLTGSLTEKISHVYLTTVKDQYEKQISELEKMYVTKIEQLEVKMKDLDAQSLMTKGNLIRNEIIKMRDQKSYTIDEYNKLKGYVNDVEKLNDNRLMSDLLNDLTYAAYYNRKEKEILPVMDKYMDRPDIDIRENSYINVASGLFYVYATSKDTELKKKAFTYINKSLEKVSDYGEALGLKLEFYMVDLEKAKTEVEKADVRREALFTLDQTLSSHYASKEADSRFKRVSTNATEKKYIEMLKNEFKMEMEKLEETSKKQTQAGSKPEDLN